MSGERATWIVVFAAVLAGCATDAPAPIQIQTRTIEVKVPTPVPCFREDEKPIPPTPTAIDIQTATVDQLADALEADAIADQIYAAAVDRLFVQCQKAGGTL